MCSKLLIICERITRFAAYSHSPNYAEYTKNGSAKESVNNRSSLLCKPHLQENVRIWAFRELRLSKLSFIFQTLYNNIGM